MFANAKRLAASIAQAEGVTYFAGTARARCRVLNLADESNAKSRDGCGHGAS